MRHMNRITVVNICEHMALSLKNIYYHSQKVPVPEQEKNDKRSP